MKNEKQMSVCQCVVLNLDNVVLLICSCGNMVRVVWSGRGMFCDVRHGHGAASPLLFFRHRRRLSRKPLCYHSMWKAILLILLPVDCFWFRTVNKVITVSTIRFLLRMRLVFIAVFQRLRGTFQRLTLTKQIVVKL